MKFSAWYGITVGFVMIAQWVFFIATVAYMTKKLKIHGDIALAMKLEALLR